MTIIRIAALLLALPAAIAAQGVESGSADAILAGAYLFTPDPSFILRLGMEISDSMGTKSREIELTVDRRDGHMYALSRVTQPAFLSDMKFLRRSERGKPDAIWIKTSRGIRRVGEGNRDESVFGSNFTVEDFGSVSSEGFDIALDPGLDTATETAIVARPRDKADYTQRIIWILRASGLIDRLEYRGSAGQTLRRYMVTKVGGTGKDARPLEAEMDDLTNGGSTKVTLVSLSNPAVLPERIFTAGAL